MPKAPSTLYNHNARLATACQLNISSSHSGRTSLSFSSSQVQVDPTPIEVDSRNEDYAADPAMDIDEDHTVRDLDTLSGSLVKVVPGIHVMTKSKAKRYINSASLFFHFHYISITPLTICRMSHWRLGSHTGTLIWMSVWCWRDEGHITRVALVVDQLRLAIDARIAR